MHSNVQTFRAATMQDALQLVRRELGADAVIFHTRHVARRRFLPWRKAGQEVEVTAGVDVNALRKAAATPRAADDGLAPPPALLPESNSRRLLGQPRREAPPRQPAPEPARSERFHSQAGAAAEPDPNAAFAEKLDAIEKMLKSLGQTHHEGGQEIPGGLFHLYTNLLDAEVEEDLSRELIFRLQRHGTPEQVNDGKASAALLEAMVEQEFRCREPIAPVRGRRKVAALIGPTGVGKTTTIAKLAANLRLRDGVRMGLVTVDTYRIAAVEQLRTYAEIIDLPMKVVTSPQEMGRALDDLEGLDLVLIDTAGRSPRDELKIQELKTLLGEARVDEVHLVLSLAASPRSLQATAKKFAAVNPTSIILTKLDEASGAGSLLSAARKVPLPISYLTTGQDVPDDIEPANAGRMARLVLGRDQLPA